MYRIPITLVFADGDTIVSAVYYPTLPRDDQAGDVCKAAAELGEFRGAVRVVVPRPWGTGKQYSPVTLK